MDMACILASWHQEVKKRFTCKIQSLQSHLWKKKQKNIQLYSNGYINVFLFFFMKGMCKCYDMVCMLSHKISRIRSAV